MLVFYDIEDDKTRTRLAHKLKYIGPRVQLSVFEADVTDKEFQQLKKMIGKVELTEDDSIRIYQFGEGCFKKAKIWASEEMTKNRAYYIA